MPHANASFIIELKKAHLGWGKYRHTQTRPLIEGEAYIPIPKTKARSLGIFNSNHGGDSLGNNIFDCNSSDGIFSGQIKASGCSEAGDIYAKQFQGNGDLKALGIWFEKINAEVGDRVKITWKTPTEVEITLLKQNEQ